MSWLNELKFSMKRIASRFVFPMCAVLFFVLAESAFAQKENVDSSRQNRDALVDSYKQLQQKPELTSAAQQEATLDPGVIIGLLQSQPALALQIKRILIKDALDQ